MSGFLFLEDFIPKEQSPLENLFLRVSEPVGSCLEGYFFAFWGKSLCVPGSGTRAGFLERKPETGSRESAILPKFLLLVIRDRVPGSWKPDSASVHRNSVRVLFTETHAVLWVPFSRNRNSDTPSYYMYIFTYSPIPLCYLVLICFLVIDSA